MLSNAYDFIVPASAAERRHLEAFVGEDFARCHPDESFAEIERRAAFTKEDKGLLREWLALATRRAEAARARLPLAA